ncbi:ROK family protein [Granulicella sp. 5B5]|uniref:ROK family protein n=1 Tax=Granulicella sp. 5B5 TaxID=1617967 RepID=UPI0031FBDDA7
MSAAVSEAMPGMEETVTNGTTKMVGVVMAERLYAGLIVDHQLVGEMKSLPPASVKLGADEDNSMVEMPTDEVIEAICRLVVDVAKGSEAQLLAVGVAVPGLIKNGVVEEAPNLPQLKGARVEMKLMEKLATHGISAKVHVVNDADAVAAGLASKHDKLDHFLRVWTLGTGIGFGTYPFTEGVWENGHTVVTLDDKERYCGCGGRGHLEGIMGHRSMRLRFLDMEPEEVFAAANRHPDPDARCLDFKKLWHKALAAATASSIHSRGAGRFYLTGYNVRFLDMNMLKDYLHQMVKMSPLQSYMLEVVDDSQSTRVLGAAVAAEQAVGR